MSKISYEEWSLKQIPSLKEPGLPNADSKVTLLYPPSIIPKETIPQALQTLASSRQALHRSRLMWSFVGMPIVAPFAIVPVIPNIPFFYLAYRAFSHYKALLGIKHINLLLEKDRFEYLESKTLDEVYKSAARGALAGSDGAEQGGEERMVIGQEEGKRVAEAISQPEVAVEWERAWGQVNRDIEAQRVKRGEIEGVEEKEKMV